MSEQPMPDSSKKVVFFHPLGAFLSNFISSCCVPVLSQPLYLCYFLFFSPYIVKILSFLAPLFVTTSLVLLSLLLSVQELGSASVLAGEPNLSTEELELYSILFETSKEHVVEQEVQETVDKFLIHGSSVKEVRVEKSEVELQGSKTGAKAIFQEKEESDEITAFAVEGQEVKQPGTESKKVVPGEGEREEEEEEFKAHVGNKITPSPRRWRSSRSFSLSSDSLGLAVSVSGDTMRPGLGSYGSMRKEKEWRRTLACKLFEERHSGGNGSGGGGGGEEGMDLLWERYEEDSSRARGRRKGRKNKGGGADPVSEAKTDRRHEEEDGDKEEEEGDTVNEGNVCCLQALKFSAGKINLGLGRPNIMGISRALRGVGWLHSVRRHRGL